MLKVGVIGAGHLGKIHLNLLKEIESYQLIGFYDSDKEVSAKVSHDLHIDYFKSFDEMLDLCDVIDIVSPTLTHYEYAQKAIKKHKHVFIEKPITNTLTEAKNLIKLSKEANVKVQIGHVERFNPAFVAVKDMIEAPMFIEAHRLAQFNPRGTDVSVVLDLMVHDIDIILSVVKSPIKKISANGVAVVSESPDIANARIEFDNGCVANLTASRISLKNMRKTRFFQRDAYISIDFLNKTTEVIKLNEVTGDPGPFAMTLEVGKEKQMKEIHFNKPEVGQTNAIKEELRTFACAIKSNKPPLVSIEDGYHVLEVAQKIIDKINSSAVSYTMN